MTSSVEGQGSDPAHESRKRRRRHTRKTHEDGSSIATLAPKSDTVVVEKASKQKPIVVLSPPKKKTARILLVSGKKDAVKSFSDTRKAFKTKRVVLTIDNTAKTIKRRNQLMKHVDELSVEQLRNSVVAAKLARKESVANVPEKLLRQMLKDYQSIRGAYV